MIVYVCVCVNNLFYVLLLMYVVILVCECVCLEFWLEMEVFLCFLMLLREEE